MPRSALLFLLLGSVPLAAASPGSFCKDDAICVDEVRSSDDVELHARNLKDFPITYTLRVRSSAPSGNASRTITRVIGARQTQQVVSVGGSKSGNSGELRLDLRWAVGPRDARHDDSYTYSLPYAPRRSYRVLQGYGSRFSHTGREEFSVDFDMPVGTAVHAARPGIVARIEESNTRSCWEDGCGKYANFIVILHDDGTTGEYYHLAKDGALVSPGERVERGQKIGLSGNTGHSTMPHLHFGVYRAIDWGRTQSISVRFSSADGIIDRPRRGARYQAN